MKKYSLLVFDWDGTLVDSEGHVIETLQKTAADLNQPIPSANEIHKHFGLSLANLLTQLFPNKNHEEFTRRFHQNITDEVLVNFFSGALETLDYLKNQGYLLAVATNRARAQLNLALNLANLNSLFVATRCPEEGAPKPAPDMLLNILTELKIEAKNALMIGDTTFDLEFALNAGVDAIAISSDQEKKAEFASWGPVGIIEKIHELKSILTKE